MQDVYLGLGSNLGDRQAMLRDATGAVSALPGTELIACSPTYENPPMGPQNQGAYLNMAAHLRTTQEPVDFVAALQQIERELGRTDPKARRHWGPREIDIDILLFGDRVLTEPTLTVPHPGMHERWFVLKPLSDIAPAAVHPVLQQSVQGLLDQLQASEVNA